MTDARIPDRWLHDRRLQRLSDAHFRSYVNALVWSASNRTDGVVEPGDLALIPNFAAGAPKALVAARLWTGLDNGWLIADYSATQTSSEQLAAAEAARIREREKKARQRAARAAAESAVQGDVPEDSPGDVPGDKTGQDRPGQDRPGQEGDQPRNERADPDSTTNGHAPDAVEWPAWHGSGPDPFEEYA